MEKDITLDEDLMKVVQEGELPLIGFQSVIMGVDHAVKQGSMTKKRLAIIEKLLRPYANINGLRAALKRHRNDVPQHFVESFSHMLDKTRGNDPDITELMYKFYFEIVYSVYYGETLVIHYEEIIKKITEMATAVNKVYNREKAFRKWEEKLQAQLPLEFQQIGFHFPSP
ncbi:MAG: hypothetical protein LBQ76_09950 [Candidatus Fibromonas sp.]|jgi:hypothetical protein|nr:hypothetical protein [Candidatus Fibromonas sp.]